MHRLFGHVHVHEQYSNNISLKKWFAVVFPAFVLLRPFCKGVVVLYVWSHIELLIRMLVENGRHK